MKKILIFSFLIMVLMAFSIPSYGSPLKLDRLSIQASKSGWKAGETSISKLSDVQKKHRLGIKKRPGIAKTKPPVIMPKTTLPASIDYRTVGFVSGIKDQGDCGSCWAFTATGALESLVMMSKNTPNTNLDLSEQVMVSCDTFDEGCNGGYPDAAANFVRDKGLPLDSCYPYIQTNGSCLTACPNWQATSYKIQSWAYAATAPNLSNIKTALSNYGPLTTTMAVYSDFMYYVSGVYKYVEGVLEGYHAILIVGYNDVGQYFIVKNSWGPGWGEEGYFKIGYSELTSVVGFGEDTIYFVSGLVPPSPSCNLMINPTGIGYNYVAHTGTISLKSSGLSCSWAVAPSAVWIVPKETKVVGNESVHYSVKLNSTLKRRTGSISIGETSYTITQETKPIWIVK